MYNMTNITAEPTMYGIVSEFSRINNNVLFGLLIFILFIVFIITFKKANFKSVFLGASFFISILSVRFFALGWLSINQISIPIVIFFISIIVFIIDRN